MRKFCKKKQCENYAEKIQNFEKQMQNFSEKVAKIHKNFENTR